MPIPIALEQSVAINAVLMCEPFTDSRMTSQQLVRAGKSMVREVIAAAMCDGVVNQSNEGTPGCRDRGVVVINV